MNATGGSADFDCTMAKFNAYFNIQKNVIYEHVQFN